ncbi:MAG TPA: VWA domain-containing protein [Candidatus Sulfotelmatobacter sp.]|nr:VWA domain-containing protein [Candidatus Sulfotelmatobacter sp.]
MFRGVRFPCAVVSFLGFLIFTTSSIAQTSINDIHVAPRERSITEPPFGGTHLPNGIGLIRSNVELVTVPVTITDAMNRPVTGFERASFRLFENKQPQEIKNFSIEDTPISIGIIMDVSGSMINKLERAREAVRQFCEASNPQDEFFMITFSDDPHLVADFTERPEEIENALLGAQPRGRTSLLDAIYMGIRKMKDARYSRRALLIISDGGDNHSRYTEHDVKNTVREADVQIYAVGTYDRYALTQEELLGPMLLESVADLTGGQSYTLTNLAELPQVTRAIGTHLRHQYVLTYRPQTRSRDGKWHKISVKVLVPKTWSSLLRVRARTGYYARQE